MGHGGQISAIRIAPCATSANRAQRSVNGSASR
jgi:hypothetical protein